jgi:hypothetical protein
MDQECGWGKPKGGQEDSHACAHAQPAECWLWGQGPNPFGLRIKLLKIG